MPRSPNPSPRKSSQATQDITGDSYPDSEGKETSATTPSDSSLQGKSEVEPATPDTAVDVKSVPNDSSGLVGTSTVEGKRAGVGDGQNVGNGEHSLHGGTDSNAPHAAGVNADTDNASGDLRIVNGEQALQGDTLSDVPQAAVADKPPSNELVGTGAGVADRDSASGGQRIVNGERALQGDTPSDAPQAAVDEKPPSEELVGTGASLADRDRASGSQRIVNGEQALQGDTPSDMPQAAVAEKPTFDELVGTGTGIGSSASVNGDQQSLKGEQSFPGTTESNPPQAAVDKKTTSDESSCVVGTGPSLGDRVSAIGGHNIVSGEMMANSMQKSGPEGETMGEPSSRWSSVQVYHSLSFFLSVSLTTRLQRSPLA
jgi:hypothetical protein